MALGGSARGASDTPPEVDAMMFKLWRQATPLQKLQKVFGFGRMINALARCEIRSRYPAATEREVELLAEDLRVGAADDGDFDDAREQRHRRRGAGAGRSHPVAASVAAGS